MLRHFLECLYPDIKLHQPQAVKNFFLKNSAASWDQVHAADASAIASDIVEAMTVILETTFWMVQVFVPMCW